jgi:cellulose synthase/poly-beta-1,6-N-acetylglucosamine synthase-like glycosyltransferase
LLAGLLSLERAAGYQTAQQSRHNLSFSAQFGGTVGGVRVSALRAAGGWNTQSITEDTDLTCALLLRGWKVAYVNRAECYEEVPQSWMVRRRQLARWVMGHTDCMHRYWLPILRSRFLSRAQKIDTLFMLACYLTAPVLVLAWVASVVLFFTGGDDLLIAFPIALMFVAYQLYGNQATFVELGVAALLDGGNRRILLLPVNLFNFFASTIAICAALLRYYGRRIFRRGGPRWEKTRRYRARGPAGTDEGTRP